jgi:hypothetical protein
LISFLAASQSKKDSAVVFGTIALFSTFGYVVFSNLRVDVEIGGILKMIAFDLPFVVASAVCGFLVGDWYTRDPRGGVLEAVMAPVVVFPAALLTLVTFYLPFIKIDAWFDDLGGHIFVAIHSMFVIPAATIGTIFLHRKHNG